MDNETEIVAPRRGRPPKVVSEEPTALDTVTVTLVKGYVPRDSKPDADGVHKKRWPGEELEVSMREAMYLCSHGIAKMEMSDV